MTHRRCDLTTVASLHRASYYADIELCIESRRIFVLAPDLMVEVYDLSGKFLNIIRDFADLFYPTDATVTHSDLPLLTITSANLVLADPVTGIVAVYSLGLRRIVFAKNLGVQPYSIAGDSETGKALISCARTATIYRIDVESGEVTIASKPSRKPRLVCTVKDHFIEVDTSTATLSIRNDKLGTTREVCFWPSRIRREQLPPTGGSLIFGVDCACQAGSIVVLQGRGGYLVPSFWQFHTGTLIPEAFQTDQQCEPLRVAMMSDATCLFLSRDRRGRYFLCATRI